MLNAFVLALLTWLGVINVWHILATSFIGAVILGVVLVLVSPFFWRRSLAWG